MEIRRYDHANDFYKRAERFLARHEAEHNLRKRYVVRVHLEIVGSGAREPATAVAWQRTPTAVGI